MLRRHVWIEHHVVIPYKEHHPIEGGGFLTDNDNGKRKLNPRFCGVAGQNAVKDQTYIAVSCRPLGGPGR